MGDEQKKAPRVGLLGRLALHYGMITKGQLLECLRAQASGMPPDRLGKVLLEDGYITRDQLDKLIRKQAELKQRSSEKPQGPQEAETPKAEKLKAAPRPVVAARPMGEAPPQGSAVPGEIWVRLRDAHRDGASDIHFQTGSKPFIRRGGRIQMVGADPMDRDTVIQLVEAILDDAKLTLLQEEGQVDGGWDLGEGLRCRYNCFEGIRGPGVVLRLVPTEIPTLEELGLPSILARFTGFSQGLVLVTGPAGCGKSSTVAALVQLINEERKENILILEDPTEFIYHPDSCNILQRQIPDHSTTYATALRAALREDPDVIVIGEMRDLETVSLALSAAETGHLVLGTMHTRDAPGTVERVIGIFPPDQQGQVRSMLSESLRGVVSQRLLRRAEGKGRVPAVEILFNNHAVANQIRENRTYQLGNIMQMGHSQGMCSLKDSMIRLMEAGTVTKKEVARAQA